MSDYISREDALGSICIDCSAQQDCRPDERCADYERIKNIPAADVAPVRHATDIYHKAHGHCEFKCSLCGVEIGVVEGGELDGGKFRYCPGCGARMDGAE